LDRKLRNPSKDDDEDIKAKSECGNYVHMSLYRLVMYDDDVVSRQNDI